MSSENQQTLNVGLRMSSGNRRMSDVNSDFTLAHHDMSEVRFCMSELAIAQEKHLQHLFSDLQKDIEYKLQDVNAKQKEFFQAMFKKHRNMETSVTEIRFELEEINTKQHNFFLETSAKQQTKLSELRKISTEIKDIAAIHRELLQEATTENRYIWKTYQERLTGFKESMNAKILELLKKQKDFEKLFINQQLQMHNLKAVSEKRLCEQDLKLRTVSEKLCEQDEKFQTLDKIIIEQEQHQLTNFQDFLCKAKDFSEKQQLQESYRYENLQTIQNIWAEQQQQPQLKLPKLFENQQNQLSLEESISKVVQIELTEQLQELQQNLQTFLSKELKLLTEKQQLQVSEQMTIAGKQQAHLQDFKCEIFDKQKETNLLIKELCDKIQPSGSALEQQKHIQELLSSETNVLSEKQLSQVSEMIQNETKTNAELQQAQLQEFKCESKSFQKEIIAKQDETDLLLKELCGEIQLSVSAIKKNIEDIQTSVQELTEDPVLGSNSSKPSQNENLSNANAGEGVLFMGDVTVGGNLIGQVNMTEYFEGNKNFKHIEIKNIDKRNILILRKKFQNQKAKSRPSEKTKSAKSGNISETHTGEQTLVALGGSGSSGDVESLNANSITWTVDARISDGPYGETLALTVGHVIIIIEVDKKRTRSLDFASKRWTDLKSPPVYRDGMKAAVDGNIIYLTGGYKHLTRCDVYDFQANKWSNGPNLSVGRLYHGSATLAGKIYCCSGRDEMWRNVISSTEVIDPRKKEKGRWTSVADMRVARAGHGLASCNRFLWAVGGWGVSSRLTGLERYDPVYDIWTKMADMKVDRYDLSFCFFSGKLYAIGGSRDESLNTVEAYDPEKNAWTHFTTLNEARTYHASCVVQLLSA